MRCLTSVGSRTRSGAFDRRARCSWPTGGSYESDSADGEIRDSRNGSGRPDVARSRGRVSPAIFELILLRPHFVRMSGAHETHRNCRLQKDAHDLGVLEFIAQALPRAEIAAIRKITLPGPSPPAGRLPA